MPKGHPGKRQLHTPVMVEEVLSLLVHNPDGVYVDCTLDGAGHAAAILGRLSHQGRLIGLDKDRDSVLVANEKLKAFGDRVFLFVRDFRELPDVLTELSIEQVSGILLDLGLSSLQLESERGFSYKKESPLDMRYDMSRGATAAHLLAQADETKLANLFASYGNVRNPRRVARSIVEYRMHRPLASTSDLVKAVRKTLPAKNPYRALSRIFQALRIAVNNELEAAHEGLRGAAAYLAPRGRVCVISYHSGEHRIVKEFLRSTLVFHDGARENLEILTRKALRPGREEITANPRSRSAQLRAGRRREHDEIS